MYATNSSIYATLLFFQIFGRPLTRQELQRWLWGQGQVGMLPGKVEEREGYLYLQGSSYPSRTEQRVMNDLLQEKCRTYLPQLRYVPGIRFVGIGNTLAFDAADEDSDIDLFIITQKGMLWWVRLCVTILLHIQGVRRHGEKVAGRFCLSFFIDETAMDFSKIAIEEDVYLRYWIATLQPIFGKQTFQRFRDANAAFVLSKIPYSYVPLTTPDDGGVTWAERLLQGIGKPLLSFVRWIQHQKMQHFPVNISSGASIVVNDHMLKFHNNDRRQKFRDTWRSKINIITASHADSASR